MSKRIPTYLSFAIYLLILFSCFNTRDNTTYGPIPQIEIEGLQDNYSVTQFDTLSLKPKVSSSINAKDLNYSWRLWSNAPGGSKLDSISGDIGLNYVVNNIPGAYTLLFTVTNNLNNVKAYKKVDLKIQGVITEGLMILQDKGGVTDFDFVSSPFFTHRVSKEIHLKNMFESIHHEKLERGRGVDISSYYTGNFQYVYLLTEKAGVRLSATTLQRLTDLSAMMIDKKPLKPQAYTYLPWGTMNFFAEVLISDGRYYNSSFNANQFTEPILRGGLSYRASPFVPRQLQWVFRGVVYDEENGRFLVAVNDGISLQSMPHVEGTTFDWNHLTAHLVYLESGFKDYEYAVMEDWKTRERSLYVINFKDENVRYDIGKYSMSGCPEIKDAVGFAVGSRGNVFYYCTKNTLFLYDYSGSNKASAVWNAKNGEQISLIKLLKPNEGRYMRNHPFDNKVLIISTKSAKNGDQIHLFYVNEANGAIDLQSHKTLSGFGDIIDIEFNYAKYGT